MSIIIQHWIYLVTSYAHERCNKHRMILKHIGIGCEDNLKLYHFVLLMRKGVDNGSQKQKIECNRS